MRSTRPNRIRRALAAGAVLVSSTAGLLATPGIAHAGTCTYTSALSGDQFIYSFCSIPDVDQKRFTLPTDSAMTPGGMYCVPTAILNALFWLEHQGYPNMLSGTVHPHDTGSATYDAVTAKVRTLGNYFGTSGVNGTNTGATVSGMHRFLSDKGYLGQLWFSWQSFEGVGDPVKKLVELGVGANGVQNLVVPVVGWYDSSGTRNGGHAVTLVKAVGKGTGSAATRQISFHDPADDNNWSTQSNPSVRTFSVGPVQYGAWGPAGQKSYGLRAKVEGYGSARLDGAYVIHRVGKPSSSNFGSSWWS